MILHLLKLNLIYHVSDHSTSFSKSCLEYVLVMLPCNNSENFQKIPGLINPNGFYFLCFSMNHRLSVCNTSCSHTLRRRHLAWVPCNMKTHNMWPPKTPSSHPSLQRRGGRPVAPAQRDSRAIRRAVPSPPQWGCFPRAPVCSGPDPSRGYARR